VLVQVTAPPVYVAEAVAFFNSTQMSPEVALTLTAGEADCASLTLVAVLSGIYPAV
jgi:hypothetical protein